MPASLPPGSKLGGYGVGLSRKVVGLALPYDEVINHAMPRMMQVSGTRLAACPGIRLDQLMIFEQLLQKMLDKRVASRDPTQLFAKNLPDLSPELFGGLTVVFQVTLGLLVHVEEINRPFGRFKPRVLPPAW
eukprot:s3324_g6.t1